MKHSERISTSTPRARARLRQLGGLSLVLAALSLTLAGQAAPRRGAWGDGEGPPDSIRGYKVERATVTLKRDKEGGRYSARGAGRSQLITLGDPQAIIISPLDVTLSLPITVSAVEQRGDIDFLLFENVRVNGVDAYVEEYSQPFALPNAKPIRLPAPLNVTVATTGAAQMAGENLVADVLGFFTGGLVEPPAEWRVSGRVYVCGRFEKFKLRFKRAVPVDFNFTMRNPL